MALELTAAGRISRWFAHLTWIDLSLWLLSRRPPPEGLGPSPGFHCELQLAESVGIGEHIDLDDPALSDCEGHDRQRAPVGSPRGCTAALDQFRILIDLSGRLTAADIASIDPLLRDRLEATLRISRRK